MRLDNEGTGEHVSAMAISCTLRSFSDSIQFLIGCDIISGVRICNKLALFSDYDFTISSGFTIVSSAP